MVRYSIHVEEFRKAEKSIKKG